MGRKYMSYGVLNAEFNALRDNASNVAIDALPYIRDRSLNCWGFTALLLGWTREPTWLRRECMEDSWYPYGSEIEYRRAI